MYLRFIQLLRETSTSNLSEGKAQQARRAENLTAIYETTFKEMLEPHLTTPLASTVCYKDSLTYLLYLLH